MLALLCCFPSCLLHAQRVEAPPEYYRGFELIETKPDSAYFYLYQVSRTSPDSIVIASALNGLAVLLANQGDHIGSLDKLLASVHYLRETRPTDSSVFSSDFNDMANNALNLRHYDDAIDYYHRAQRFSTSQKSTLIYLNGEGVAYRQKGNYEKAIHLLDSIVSLFQSGTLEYARTLSNLGKAKWMQDPLYNPTGEFWTALGIRLDSSDQWGLNASYDHLSDYYEKKNRDSANYYARKMYETAQLIESPDDQLIALDKLIRIGSPAGLGRYYNIYKKLDDSLKARRDTVRNQFALIAYEVEQNKTDLARSKADNERKELQIARQRLIIFSGVIAFGLIVFLGVTWYQKRKQRLRREAEEKIRDYRLKTSQKVHDVVANGLYRVMTTIEHRDDVTKEELLDSIELLYEQSRDISYERSPETAADFHEMINRLLSSFASESVRVWIAGNGETVWSGTGTATRETIMKVLEELMINMRKHSKADNVTVKFERLPNALKITYRDDGVGIQAGSKKGNGLESTGNRIKALGGQIIFESNEGNGLPVTINIPQSPTK